MSVILKAGVLSHGGIMVNYQCTAACRHCLYACSPTRAPGYITAEKAREIGALLRQGGCASVHIGGGEPFLDFEGLLRAVQELRRSGITVEYIETNAFWVGEENVPESNGGSDTAVIDRLRALRNAGGTTLCISIDPFHAEYVPYGYPLRLARLCEKAGMDYFLWKQEFLRSLSGLSPAEPHSRAELEKALGKDYIGKTALAYGIRFGGRAIGIEENMGKLQSARALADGTPCRNLLSGGHFHIDKDGYFIPPGCTGLLLPLEDLVRGIPEGAFPVFETLYQGGSAALLSLAEQSGFVPDPAGYSSRCVLCFFLRRCLAAKGFTGLDAGHYEESLMYCDSANISAL